MTLSVASEVGRLRRVMVHTPGEELGAVTPDTRGAYLYDDIIDPVGARREHQQFCQVLGRFAEVVYTTQLVAEVLAEPAARAFLLARSEQITADHQLREQLGQLTAAQLVQAYIGGYEGRRGPLGEHLQRPAFALPPLPNLLYSRDGAVVVGQKLIVAAMHHAARWPEEALMRLLVGHHPLFAGGQLTYDGSDERRAGFSLEGGDVHPLAEDLLLVGLSERSSASSVDLVTQALMERGPIEHVVAVVLPQRAHTIHLDMVWTQVDRQQCLVHAPMFVGRGRLPVLLRRKGRAQVQEFDDFFVALGSLGHRFEPILCGGTSPLAQAREQWASGCNALAVAPGQVLTYGRNTHTLAALAAAGLPTLPAERLLGQAALPEGRFAVALDGGELVRGGGGPRCMSCPMWREA